MTSPITAEARIYVRNRATEVMEYRCQITRSGAPEGYDEDTLIFTAEGPTTLVYDGPCRVWELSAAASVVVGDTDVYQQSTQLSIPWDTDEVIKRYDQVEITEAPGDPEMLHKRFEVQTIARSGALRATRRFEVTAVM